MMMMMMMMMIMTMMMIMIYMSCHNVSINLSGLVEVITNSMSLDALKKTSGRGSSPMLIMR